jgi:hypothetical protein
MWTAAVAGASFASIARLRDVSYPGAVVDE